MVKKKSDYHILVAQNFLSNISIDGSHNDTNLRIFRAKGLPKLPSEKKISNGESSVELVDIVENELFVKETPQKKTSIFRRIAKIMSSDDVIYSMTATSSRTPILEEEIGLMEFRSESPSCSSNQFSFLRRLKSTITHADRFYVCSAATGHPFAVFSYLSTNNDYVDPLTSIFANVTVNKKKFRSKSIFGSSDRVRHQTHASIEELRPFVFRDSDDHFVLGQMRRKRNASPFFTLFDKPAHISKNGRRESFRIGDDDFSADCIEIPSSVNRDSSYERGTSLDDKLEFEIRPEEPPEPADEYDPNSFWDQGIGKRTVIRHDGFVASTHHYETPERAKSEMNEGFETKYPNVHLTLSKMNSLKREMVEMAKMNKIDVYTLASAFVHFEKIIGKGLISKANRKCVAGVALLVALKMNDYSKTAIKLFMERAEEQLRETKHDVLAYELPLCSALQFCLQPTLDEIRPHVDRLQFEI